MRERLTIAVETKRSISTLLVDPRTEGVEVTRPRLLGNRPQRSGSDAVVHRDAHHPNVLVVGQMLVPKFDVTTRPVDDKKPVFRERFDHLTPGERS
jgi:hypothetical protein